MQTVIGSNDVKSTPVYFYVQRTTSFTANGTVPFDVERLNIGDGMDYESGVFTAPKAGIYFFNFDGMKRIDNSTLKLHLYLNDDLVETTYAPVSNVYQHFSLSSNLRLQLGDQVKLVLGSGGLYDNESHYGGFIGMLLQEELSAD
jgi:C1q-related factor